MGYILIVIGLFFPVLFVGSVILFKMFNGDIIIIEDDLKEINKDGD